MLPLSSSSSSSPTSSPRKDCGFEGLGVLASMAAGGSRLVSAANLHPVPLQDGSSRRLSPLASRPLAALDGHTNRRATTVPQPSIPSSAASSRNRQNGRTASAYNASIRATTDLTEVRSFEQSAEAHPRALQDGTEMVGRFHPLCF